MLITIEGPDQAGKTTQIEKLKEYAEKNGKDWIFTRQPGGTELGTKLREIILNVNENISDKAELLMYLADRAHHVEEFIKPALKQGKVVICDRYIDSTLAYQGYGRGLDIKEVQQLNQFAIDGVKPDLTVMLMVSDKVAEERQTEKADRLESENKLFFVRVRNGYKSIAREEPLRLKIIDTDELNIEQVHEKTVEMIEARITAAVN